MVSLVGSLMLVMAAHVDAAPPAGAPIIKLLAAGKGPTRKLRITAKPGDHQTLVMTMAMGMGMQSGGKDLVPMTRVPAIHMTLDLEVESVAPNGDIRCKVVFSKSEIATDASANPAVVAAMKKSLAGLDGLSGYSVITSRGFTKDADFKVGPNADPQLTELLDGMRQSLRQLSAPLPAEAVGKDARWQTTMKIEVSGTSLTQVGTSHLVELSDNSAKIEVELKQSAGRQKIQRNGMSVELISLTSSGSGDLTLDLGHVMASPATMSVKSASEMEVMGQKMHMTLDMTFSVKTL
jgi:hypothetical protein